MMRVRMLYDVEGWAWWHRVNNIRRHLPAEFEVEIGRPGEPFDHEGLDYILIFESMFWSAVAHVPSHKVIVGCSCPVLVGDLLDLLREVKPAAALVLNEAMARVVSREYRCYCCPNGVDEQIFFPRTQEVARHCGAWVGSTHSFVDKGLTIIEEACRRMGLPLISLDQASRLQSRETVAILSHEELREHVYHQSSIVFCASDSEGMPNPALEALACGVPVVSTRVGVMPELIVDGRNGFLAERSVDGFCWAIERLLAYDQPALLRRARESILHGWTWRQRALAYALMFRDLQRRQAIKC